MSYYNAIINEEITLLEWFKKMHLAKGKINYLIDNHFCYCNGNIIYRDSLLNKGDYLCIDLSNYDDAISKTYDYFINVLYEDEYLLIIDKPEGFVIYDDNRENTITNMVNNYLLLKGVEVAAYPAHRLDEGTSGCLIYCKDIITLAYMSFLFESNKVNKQYLAIVEGNIKSEGLIDKPIGNNRHLNNTMIVIRTGKKAVTKYKKLKSKNNLSKIRVTIETGRTHQIRVHLSYLGYPIVGDIKYGSKIKASRIMLHCEKITFRNYSTGKEMHIVAKIPTEMNKLVN